jgi:hypothetical protein
MALSVVGSGSQLCDRVTPTEHTLDTETTAGTYLAKFNLTTAANGDVFRIRVYAKVLTGDTAEVVYEGDYAHDQGGAPIITTPPWISMFSTYITIQQTAGTARTIPWELILVAT